MPSKTVSFSDDGYVKLIQRKPEDANFSEWVEHLAIDRLNAEEEVQFNN